MGLIIAAVTPGTRSNRPIPRVHVTSLDMAIVGRVQIRYHRKERRGMAAVTYQKFVNFKAQTNSDNLDVLRKTWSGMMQFVHHGDHPGKASVIFLPIVDMNYNDTTCIYSTLTFVTGHTRCHGVSPSITFDQRLRWTALMIIRSEPLVSDLTTIFLHLGGFHAEMSFLGCIGHVMASSGLQEVLDLICGPTAVVHMLSGKAIA